MLARYKQTVTCAFKVSLTVWLTPHIKTLRIGSLARNNLTFCPIKCFFFVLVLLALTGAAPVQLDDMSPGSELMVRKKTVPQRAFARKRIIRNPRVFKKRSKSASCSSSSLLRFSERGREESLNGESALEHFVPSPPFLLPSRPRWSPESS